MAVIAESTDDVCAERLAPRSLPATAHVCPVLDILCQHRRLFDVSRLAWNRRCDRYDFSCAVRHYLCLYGVAFLLARVEHSLSFGILRPVDWLLGGIKQSDQIGRAHV